MKVGFIGLGNVGAKLAGSLLRNGADIMVCDLDTERVSSFIAEGAKGTIQASEVMRTCDFVITCLPSPAASDAIICEMLPYVTEVKFGWKCLPPMKQKSNALVQRSLRWAVWLLIALCPGDATKRPWET